jgi:6-pyruvoyltetrahydropterin/6-carboxytetrahydropterin synthase
MPGPVYKISVEKDYLVFASGHFITYGDECEALHGHNYRASVEIEGELDENAYVFNFVTLKRIMRRLVDELDHRMLVPTENPHFDLDIGEREVQLTYREGSRRYVFPREDVVLLPIPNTTAEMLARHLARRLRAELAEAETGHLSSITVAVEEAFGQQAHYRESLRG